MGGSTYGYAPATPPEEEREETTGPVIFEPQSTSWHMPARRAGPVIATTCLGLVALVAICVISGGFKDKTHTLAYAPNVQKDGIKQEIAVAIIENTTTIPTAKPTSTTKTKSESADFVHQTDGIVRLLVKVLREMAGGISGAAELSEDTYEDAKKWFKKANQSMHEFKKVSKQVKEKLNWTAHEIKRVGKAVVEKLEKPIRLSMVLKQQLQSLTPARKGILRNEILKGLDLTSLADLRPADTGGCYEDEELHEGLCYKRCAILTLGQEPVRVSPFQCCTHPAPCFGKLDIEPTLCSGYAVGGKASGNGCARQPALCLQSEEFAGGLCYMRCNLLSYGLLPYRSTSDTCCKANSPLAMLVPGECDTDEVFNMAGGGQDSSVPGVPHPPEYTP